MEVVRALAAEIGPRPPGSRAEARAARWCAAHLEELGYEAEIETFSSRASYQPYYATYLGLAALAAVLIVPAPPAALLLGLTALVAYGRDAEGRPLVAPRGAQSCNVVARRAGEIAPPELIVLAHLDSARAALNFHPRMVGALRASVVALQGVLVAVVFMAGLAFVAGERAPRAGLWAGAALAAAYLVWAIALLLHAEWRMPHVPGANDNASGVEVVLRLARLIDHHRVWFVLTGSEESGMVGVQAFYARHGSELAGARFLNIDSVGAGEVVAADEEGIFVPRRADQEMVAGAERAGARVGTWRLLPTDGSALLSRRMRGLTLVALDERGLIAHWHWPTDTAERVDPATLDTATAAALGACRAVLGEGALP